MTQNYAKMEESSLEQQHIITILEHTCQDLKEQQVVACIEFDKEKQNLTTQIQKWECQYETTQVQLNKPNPILPIRMNNMLKYFEKFLLDNTLFNV
jgi:hypothetical protein